MEFKIQVSPWIEELKGFVFGEKENADDLKKNIKSADLSKINYEDKAYLYKLFDPKSKVSHDTFAKEFDLYFELLEKRGNSVSLPVFGEYVEWILSQDPSKFDDKTFVLIAKKLIKYKNQKLPQQLVSFAQNIVSAYGDSIDKMSNEKLSILMTFLIDSKIDYENLNEECQDFVKQLYVACSVREEISRRNKFNFRGKFKSNQELYFGMMNQAFAGRDMFSRWIPDPSKRLQVPFMIDYANYQNRILAEPFYRDIYTTGRRVFDEMGLHYLPDINEDINNIVYLEKPRDYTNYIKRMVPLFKQMIEFELDGIVSELVGGDKKKIQQALSQIVKTDSAKMVVNGIRANDEVDLYQKIAVFLGEKVGLFDALQQASTHVFEKKEIEKRIRATSQREIYAGTIWARIENNMCDESDYQDLIELLQEYPDNKKIQEAIYNLESMMFGK